MEVNMQLVFRLCFYDDSGDTDEELEDIFKNK